MLCALLDKVVPASIAGRSEQGRTLPSRVVKGDWGSVLDILLNIRHERSRQPIPGILGPMSIEITNSICEFPVDFPEQVFLLQNVQRKGKNSRQTHTEKLLDSVAPQQLVLMFVTYHWILAGPVGLWAHNVLASRNTRFCTLGMRKQVRKRAFTICPRRRSESNNQADDDQEPKARKKRNARLLSCRTR